MKYKVECYMKMDIEPDEEVYFETLKEAKAEKEHNELLQPENIYKIVMR